MLILVTCLLGSPITYDFIRNEVSVRQDYQDHFDYLVELDYDFNRSLRQGDGLSFASMLMSSSQDAFFLSARGGTSLQDMKYTSAFVGSHIEVTTTEPLNLVMEYASTYTDRLMLEVYNLSSNTYLADLRFKYGEGEIAYLLPPDSYRIIVDMVSSSFLKPYHDVDQDFYLSMDCKSIPQTPEPMTAVLALIGTLGVGLIRMGKKKPCKPKPR